MSEELDSNLLQQEQSIKDKKEIEKLQLEIDKLNNENKELTKTWWKKPRYIIAIIAAISPVIVGIATLLVAWGSGFLQAQSKLNEVQRQVFENDKKEIQKVINDLHVRILIDSVREKMLLRSVDSLKSVGEIAKQRLDSFFNDKRSVSEKVISLIKENGILQDDVKNLNAAMGEFSDREKKYKAILDSLSLRSEKNIIPKSNTIRFYPNPVNDLATLEISTFLPGNIYVSVIDMEGKTVFSKVFGVNLFYQNENINLGSLQKGTYILSVMFVNGERSSLKIIKS